MECKNCGNSIVSPKKFCNSSCSATFNNKNRVRSAESKAKTSLALRKPLPEDEIIKLYENGESPNKLAKKFNCGREAIIKLLKRNNLVIRTRSTKLIGKQNPDSYKVVNNKNRICEKHNCEYSSYKNGIYVCKKCCNEKISEYRRNLKLKAVEYKGGKCQHCGYSKSVSALEFHHIDPNEKDFGISTKGSTRSFEKIKLELDKCIMLCANCHREEHDRLFKNYS